jgi:hypothetical protein
MVNEKRIFKGGLISALVVEWILIALVMPNGFVDLMWNIGPAALLAVAFVWVFFTFADSLFTWRRAAMSVLVGAAITTPLLAYYFTTSNDQNIVAKFFFMIAVGWAASFGGTLWNLVGAVDDALKEWRAERRVTRVRKLYVPA